MSNAALKILPSRWVENEKNTFKSYGIALCIVIAFLFFLTSPARRYVVVNQPVMTNAIATIIEKIHIQLPPLQEGGGSSSNQQRSVGDHGTPKPIFQLVVPTEPNVHSNDPIDWSPGEIGSEKNGNTPGSGTSSDGKNPSAATDSNVILEDEVPFVAYEQEPSFSMDALRSAVRYPEMALRMQIEGRVIIRAYVDADGSLSKVSVANTDNPLLDEAALIGVRKIQYEPALQNGQATGCWIHIPVSFELRN